MAFSLAAAVTAAPLKSGGGAKEGRGGRVEGGEHEAPGAATSHLNLAHPLFRADVREIAHGLIIGSIR